MKIKFRDNNIEKIDLLDHGFVKLIDSCGDDQRVVDAARVSISGENVKATTSNENLIRYLMRNKHTTPFEMIDVTFHVKTPIFVARQWMRHRTFSYNEMSGRYSELPEEFYVPEHDDVKFQSTTNNQGRAKKVSDELYSWFSYIVRLTCGDAFRNYKTFLGKKKKDEDELTDNGGISRELSRTILPVGTYTEFFVKGNLHNWFRFIQLRKDHHAQHEIYVYAAAIEHYISEMFPLSHAAFRDYCVDGLHLTKHDIEAIRKRLVGTEVTDSDFPTKREHREFNEKLKRIM